MKVDYNKFLVKPKSTVVHAFDSGGVPYFKFESLDKLPIQRMEAAKDIELQNSNRVDDKYLDAFQESLEELLNQGNLAQIAVLNLYLKERRKYLTSIELAYAYASVLYFSYDENPNRYDPAKADKKIKHWIENDDVEDFFLKAHFQTVEGFWTFTMPGIGTYTRAQTKQLLQFSRFHLSILQETSKNPVTVSHLKSQMETLEKLLD